MPTQEELISVMNTLLNIPEIKIQEVIQDRDGNYIIRAISTKEGTKCHKCGRHASEKYGYGESVMVRHLPICGKEVYLEIRMPRYRCTACEGNPTTTQTASWFDRRSHFTHAFEEHIVLACVNSTIADVSKKEKIGYSAVLGIIEKYVKKEIDWDMIRFIHLLGIDEISLKKGHKNFVAIITARINNETVILGVLKSRTKEEVKKFFLSIPKRLRKTVKYVCSDMYDGFINAAKEVFGKKVEIVVDRFHVAKLYRDGFETLRKGELRRLKKELSKSEYKKLEGSMWILRKKEEDLTKEEKEVLIKLFKHSPKLKDAYNLRNELTAIFDEKIPRPQAKRRISGWIAKAKRSEIRCFDGFIKTLEARKNEICNYFNGRHTSGFVEGLNNKIKVIKRRCYGITNTEHLFQRIYLDLHGYSLYL